MKHKVEQVSSELAARLGGLPGMECVTLAEITGEDATDPYFFLSLDAFYHGKLPDAEARQQLFSDSGAFETSTVTAKDRFLINGFPIRVEYKDTARVDEILGTFESNLWVFRQTGTYMFHRLENATILVQKTDWIQRTRKTLGALPEAFWSLLGRSSLATMEHYLSDFAAAVIRRDPLFSVISAAGFIKSCCSVLFVLNHSFEPSSRLLYSRVLELPRLPAEFGARFESFLGNDPDYTPERKREIAEHIATSIIRLAS